jgi:hypothetical protein
VGGDDTLRMDEVTERLRAHFDGVGEATPLFPRRQTATCPVARPRV